MNIDSSKKTSGEKSKELIPIEPHIAVALSGGGFRASVFHLGMLLRLAEAGWLNRVDVVSTVSGGSIIGAFAVQRWEKVLIAGATPQALREIVIDPFLELIQSRNFMKDWALQLWKVPFRKSDKTYTRTKLAAELYSRRFYDEMSSAQLPERPYLVINAAALVSIRAWRFTRDGLGDSRYGHARWTDNPLSLGEAVGASAAFPPVFTPPRIRRSDYQFSDPIYGEETLQGRSIIPLSDGGVYDNVGLEVLAKKKGTQVPVEKQIEPCQFLTVSDAGYPPQYKFRNSGIPVLSEGLLLFRVDDIARTQVRALRKRQLIRDFEDPDHPVQGSLVMLGSSIDSLPKGGANKYFSFVDRRFAIPVSLIKKIETVRTHLDRFSPIECEALMYHSYTMTDAFLWYYRDEHPTKYRVPEKPDPEWKIEFTPAKISEWKEGLKDSHERRILWPR